MHLLAVLSHYGLDLATSSTMRGATGRHQPAAAKPVCTTVYTRWSLRYNITQKYELYENNTQLCTHSCCCGTRVESIIPGGNSSHTSSTTPLAIIAVLHHDDQGTRPARRREPMTTNPGTERRVHVLSSPRSTAVDDTETKSYDTETKSIQ